MLEQIWKNILRSSGLSPWLLLRPLLWLFSLFYYVACICKRMFAPSPLKLSTPVVSVGNISVGGTGKTPLVALLAQRLSDKGYRVGIAASGYGRRGKVTVCDTGENLAALSADEIGDEVRLLAEMLPEVMIAIDRTKAAAAARLAANRAINIILIDDGFQHVHLARDVDIVVVDASVLPRLYRMFPLGVLREPLRELKRAHAIVLTRADLCADLAGLTERAKQLSPTAALFRAQFDLSELISATGRYPITHMRDRSVMLFAGVGNFPALLRQIEERAASVVYAMELGDHQRYDQALMHKIRHQADTHRPDLLITTAKDWTKVSGFDFGREICYVRQSMKLEPEAEQFIAFLTTKLGRGDR